MTFGLRGRRAYMLGAPLFVVLATACTESSTIVAVHGVAADLAITVADEGTDMASSGPVETLEVPLGGTVSLAALATNAVGLPVGSVSVTWVSSDPAVVAVTSEGVVTAIAPGTAEVEATAGEATASVAVVVTGEVPPA